MSLMDEIFDVEEAVKGTEGEVPFERVMKYFNEVEADRDALLKIYKVLRRTITIAETPELEDLKKIIPRW
jgi:hypothetical protein